MNADTLEPAYLLHLRRYRNTSALIDIFTPNYGRLGAVVKGVFSKGAHAQQLRSQLQLATPLLVAMSGRSELKSITHLEAVGHALVTRTVVGPVAQGNALYCVMYVNELLVRLLPAQIACASLFAAYQAALEDIAQQQSPEMALRRFELQLLDTLGYAIDFSHEAQDGQPIQADACYRFVPAIGFVPCPESGTQADRFTGSELQAIGAGQFAGESARVAKRLMRLAINHHLGGRPLNSRALFKPLRQD